MLVGVDRGIIGNMKELTGRQLEVCRRIAAGQRVSEICRGLGMNKTTVWRVRTSEAGRAYMKELRTAADASLVRMMVLGPVIRS